MTTQNKNVPALRFPEFSEKWDFKYLENLSTNGFSNGIFNDPKKVGKGYKLINVKDMYVGDSIDINTLTLIDIDEKEFRRNKVEYGDIFFTRSSLVKEGIAHSNVNLSSTKDITFDGHIIRMRPNTTQILPKFLAYLLKTSAARRQLIVRGKTTTMTTIGQEEIGTVVITFPTLPEQLKIAAFLTAVDEKIQQLTKQKDLVEQYKKGVMQKIFNQEIRFKDDNGNDFADWELTELKEIAVRVTAKNKSNNITKVLTNSATKGIVNQQDYFDKDIANQNNLQGYYIVEKDDFVYNPRISTSAPVGPIKRNNLERGLMSPLYSVFRFKGVKLDFIEHFFETRLWHDYLKSIANYGARHDRMNITVEGFFDMPILLPLEPEQEKIADFLSAIDGKINLVNQQLEKTQTFKKGLLQQMFI